MCVRDIEFAYFYDFFIECWNCSKGAIGLPWDRPVLEEYEIIYFSLHMKSEMFHSKSSFT
jgi:hypothetical protein